MTPTRPYLVKAFFDWIVDNNLTPYILVDAEMEGVDVPKQYIKDGKIVFNITTGIVEGLHITNTSIEFDARFSGVLTHIFAPIKAVLAIYARENGRGMVFDDEESEGDDDETPPPDTSPPDSDQPRKGKPKLTVVK